MKIIRVSLAILAVLFLSRDTLSHAQTIDLSLWVGKWFKVSISSSGYCLEEGALKKDTPKFTAYLKAWDWDPGQGVLKADLYLYQVDTDQWEVGPFNLNYFSGDPLNFVFWVDEEKDNSILGGEGQITGKEKNGILTGGSIKMPAGFHRDYSNHPGSFYYCSGGFNVTGSLTSSVPVPPGIIRQPAAPLAFSFSPCSSGGDSITVSGVTGTSATIIPGAEYEICGTYTLNSRDSAQIVAANYSPYGLVGSKGSNQNIGKGSGSYCVSFTVENVEPGFEKKIGMGFYPWPSGDQFFGSGYGCSDIVLQ